MPYYRAVGTVPEKRHVLFTTTDGDDCYEELIGEEGFAGTSSLLYHRRVPANLVDSRRWELPDHRRTPNTPLRPRHFRLPDLFPAGSEVGVDAVRGRRLVLANDDVRIGYVVADTPSPLYCDGVGDEVVFVESGAAVLESVFGRLEIRQGDNVVIPRAVIHRWIPQDVAGLGPLRAYCVESSGHVRLPSRHRTREGQMLEGSPVTERDLRVPDGLIAVDDLDVDTEVHVKHRLATGVDGSVFVYDHHPFDVVGWDGYLYPYAVNYRDFSPVVGEVVQPPTTYQLLEADAFAVCNFVPRPLEFHPRAVKVPYYHSNTDSDEVMFYFAGETAARKGSGIVTASVSLHPAAYTHGPVGPAYLESIHHTRSTEMAFMVDTFRPLELGEGALAADQPDYLSTWTGRHPEATR